MNKCGPPDLQFQIGVVASCAEATTGFANMAFTIGLRFYRIYVRRKGSTENVPIGPGQEPCDLLEYIADFVSRKATPTVEEATPRTWFFEARETNTERVVHGYINYGTHGFESTFRDIETGEEKYRREAYDLEEIPLYFQFWVPTDLGNAFVAFQSFQGRSCIDYVRNTLIKDFCQRFPGFDLIVRIITSSAAIRPDAPVKTFTLINPKAAADRFDAILKKPAAEVSYEITVRTRKRGGILSTYKDIGKLVSQSDNGLVEFDGQEFEGAKAEISVGSKRRTVGILGSGSDAGLIDVTENIKRDRSGHPTFDSIVGEVNDIMSDFYLAVS